MLLVQLIAHVACDQCSSSASGEPDLADFLQAKVSVEPMPSQRSEETRLLLRLWEEPFQLPFATSLTIAVLAFSIALLPQCGALAFQFRSRIGRAFAGYAAKPGNSPTQVFAEEASRTQFQTVFDLLPNTGDPCIYEIPETGGRPPLSFAALRIFAFSYEMRLDRFGIRREDRVCTMIPNGPEAAVCFLVFPLRCVFAPLNPAYTRSEVEFEFEDLPCHTVMLEHSGVMELQRSCKDLESPAAIGLQVAKDRNVQVLLMSPSAEVAGLFTISLHGTSTLNASPNITGGREILNQRNDLAMVVHTSGTTKKPKIVPLTHENLLVGALCVKSTLQRSAKDIGLNIMPLYHMHGQAVNVLATLVAGSRVICSPGYKNPAQALAWLSESGSTWYSAVPTMHLGILDVAESTLRSGEIVSHSCALVRNCSAALAPVIAERLEDALACTVLPTYAMSESVPIASNPLPPYRRNLRSVGFASGPKLRLQDEKGDKPSEGVEGEVCINGECVTSGYEYRAHMDGNPNIEAFTTDRWLRTGDKGYFDAQGHLCLTGRFKEIINRGGEKLSPLEIESVLRHSKDVQDCLAFSVPHVQLGETVGLAIQLRATSTLKASPQALSTIQDFALKRGLNEKWIPEVLVLMSALPKGSTGKPARIGLAKRLGVPTMDASSSSLSVFDASSGSIRDCKEEAQSNVAEPQRVIYTRDSLGIQMQSSEESLSEVRTIFSIYGVAILLVIDSHLNQARCLPQTPIGYSCLFEMAMKDYPLALGLSRHFLDSSRYVTLFTMCFGYLEGKERKFNFDGKRELIVIAALFWNFWMKLPLLALKSLITGEDYDYPGLQPSFDSFFTLDAPADYYIRFMLVARLLLLMFHKLRVPAWMHAGVVCAGGVYFMFHPEPAWWMALTMETNHANIKKWKPAGPRHGLPCWTYQYLLFVVAAYYFPPAIQAGKSAFSRIKGTFSLGWCGRAFIYASALLLLVCFPDVFYPNRPYKLFPSEDQVSTDGMQGWYCTSAETTLQASLCYVSQLPMDCLWMSALAVLLFPGCRFLESIGQSSMGIYLIHLYLFNSVVNYRGIVIRGKQICPALPVIMQKIASLPTGHWYGVVVQVLIPVLTWAAMILTCVSVALVSGWLFNFLFNGFLNAAASLLPLCRKWQTCSDK